MSDEILQQQINDLVNGTISEAEHRTLQDRLKTDAAARHVFRERMDVEAGLRTLFAADVSVQPAVTSRKPVSELRRPDWRRWRVALIATAASIVVFAVWWTQRSARARPELAEQPRQTTPQEIQPTERLLGRLVQQADCVWQQAASLQEGRFAPGTIKLTSGAAELRFDSGTNVVLNGPCELAIETTDSARLLAGSVFVEVTEVSNGFLLATPEAQIIDEGTQYAVALDSRATEVHVFAGSVIWTPAKTDTDFADRIPSGEARRYLRGDPGRAHRIPFGKRQFVRRIEEAVRETGGGDLLAYDGFENLAGQLRRGRSGFGWAGGWESAGRGRRSLAEVIDAPPGVVFGIERSGRRLLALRGGDSLRREFEKPIALTSPSTLYVSLLVSRQSRVDEAGSSLQVVLEPASDSARYARRHSVTFGITSEGRPFVNNAGTIDEAALELAVGELHLLVFRYEAHARDAVGSLRIYRPGDAVESISPTAWTAHGTAAPAPIGFKSLRITLGTGSATHVDELRVGTSWSAVVRTSAED